MSFTHTHFSEIMSYTELRHHLFSSYRYSATPLPKPPLYCASTADFLDYHEVDKTASSPTPWTLIEGCCRISSIHSWYTPVPSYHRQPHSPWPAPFSHRCHSLSSSLPNNTYLAWDMHGLWSFPMNHSRMTPSWDLTLSNIALPLLQPKVSGTTRRRGRGTSSYGITIALYHRTHAIYMGAWLLLRGSHQLHRRHVAVWIVWRRGQHQGELVEPITCWHVVVR